MRITKDPVERKKEILDASLELFLEKGYEKTSVKDIVTKVGVAQGLFYYYFPSKEALVTEIGLQLTTMYRVILKPAYEICEIDPIEAIQVFFEVSFSFFKTQMDLFDYCNNGNMALQVLIGEAFISPSVEFFAAIIKSGNDKKIFDCQYPMKSSTALVYGILYFIGPMFKIEKFYIEKDFIISYLARVLNVDSNTLVGIL